MNYCKYGVGEIRGRRVRVRKVKYMFASNLDDVL